MSQFKLDWFSAPAMVNPNAIGQRALYRQRSLGGSFISTGFTPANNLLKTTQSVNSPILAANKIWEFKVQTLCTTGGPVDNDNGIQESLEFACINPTIIWTDTTSMISLNILGLDITKARFTLRLTGDNSIVFGPVTTLPVGNGIAATATGLEPQTSYYWQYELYSTVNGTEIISSSSDQLGTVCGPYTFSTDESPVEPDLIWIAGAKSCEKAGGFGEIKTITGVYSPARSWYDPITTRTYIADNDSPLGNVYWFNQATATVAADMTYSTAVNSNFMYNTGVDPTYRRIYFVGRDTGGLLVYNVDTDTTSVVPYGVNSAFSRITLEIFDNVILCNDFTTALVTIDRSSLTILSTIPFSGIPNNTRFAIGGNSYASNGTNMYVCAGSGSSVSSIGVYNSNFSVNIANITLPGATTWDGGKYWQSIYYDPVSTHLYVADFGSNQRFVIDTTSNTVIDQQTYNNREGKSNVTFSWTTNPITGDLICVTDCRNNSTESTTFKRSYLQNRTTHAFDNMYNGSYFYALNHVVGTDRVIGTSTGGVFWSGISTPDGTITVLSSSVGSDNTGTQIVNTLIEVDANNGNAPTGNSKPNAFGDPDYIAPITNTTDCPITTSTNCPDPGDVVTTFNTGTLYYEFTIPTTVKNNTAVDKIRVSAYNTDTSSVDGTPTTFTSPTEIYYSGSFTGLAGTNYTIQVEYLNSSNVVLNTCNSF
jgi:hypothetical protein